MRSYFLNPYLPIKLSEQQAEIIWCTEQNDFALDTGEGALQSEWRHVADRHDGYSN